MSVEHTAAIIFLFVAHISTNIATFVWCLHEILYNFHYYTTIYFHYTITTKTKEAAIADQSASRLLYSLLLL